MPRWSLRHDYNLDETIDHIIGIALSLQNITKLSHQMWACGSDFQYQNGSTQALCDEMLGEF